MSSETRRYTVNIDDHTPESVLPIDPEFAREHAARSAIGGIIAAYSRVCFVGMARQIVGILPATLRRIEHLGSQFKEWSAVVVENDSTDGTKDLLAEWSQKWTERVIVDSRDLGREKLSGFEAARVERYQEYRTRYRDLAKASFPNVDYVIALDLDPWGGWDDSGVMSSLAFLDSLPNAAGMASTSLYQGRIGDDLRWLHYDLWALRLYGWQPRWDPWLPLWLPPPGAPPVPVRSAFGALCVYRARPFFSCTPRSIDGDIEHVGLHREMREQGFEMYLNPASRTVMHWIPSEDEVASDAAG